MSPSARASVSRRHLERRTPATLSLCRPRAPMQLQDQSQGYKRDQTDGASGTAPHPVIEKRCGRQLRPKRRRQHSSSSNETLLIYRKARRANRTQRLDDTNALKRVESRSDDVEVRDAAHHVLVFRFLAVQLDHEPQLIDRVGVAQRILVTDLTAVVQIEQVLVERLHAQLA
jgi:hypothetical protein